MNLFVRVIIPLRAIYGRKEYKTDSQSSMSWFVFFSVSSYPDQPTEQRRVPVHLPRESLRWLPIRSHRPPSGCDELHWLKQTRVSLTVSPSQKVCISHLSQSNSNHIGDSNIVFFLFIDVFITSNVQSLSYYFLWLVFPPAECCSEYGG